MTDARSSFLTGTSSEGCFLSNARLGKQLNENDETSSESLAVQGFLPFEWCIYVLHQGLLLISLIIFSTPTPNQAVEVDIAGSKNWGSYFGVLVLEILKILGPYQEFPRFLETPNMYMP